MAMASLRDMVSEYQDDLRNGIAWLAFWREGRSWQAEAFHLNLDDTLYPEDRARLAEIQAADPQAVVVNGYYSGYLSEKMGVTELAAGVRHPTRNSQREARCTESGRTGDPDSGLCIPNEYPHESRCRTLLA